MLRLLVFAKVKTLELLVHLLVLPDSILSGESVLEGTVPLVEHDGTCRAYGKF